MTRPTRKARRKVETWADAVNDGRWWIHFPKNGERQFRPHIARNPFGCSFEEAEIVEVVLPRVGSRKGKK